ncbi:MAG: 4-hydroxy-tetrahydrodipicolinate synthase [Flavobacteriales bacterium]|jgi:4-hydroxy-tetrahydrodipicolinate synthase|nr:4-hydroxy-tetrahydrodipicolinate synthase [Flavobacteriales bacterium]MBK6894154.1 4-hydroxy-tetrahydrodipicolinate synthase [Flavobacteriales bacterium]MBK7248090.1 4-hydroxy-tetrahydrodipicolinate synthase [Flavobacteriales bacterium]MBK9059724.1 4-hydroxy-tetrahydrodipicolinate synthase [Flavobacteriales bacterium]MBK9598448.1 4-hydroxy-tetrahydrodipicolinate synthase [Flavobacteriales bacterium]
MDNRFQGLGVALITPFRANGAIDHAALAKVIEHQITGGIDFLVVMGTTGESATISTEEKKQLLAQVIEVVHDRVPIVLGIGGNNTAEVIEQFQAFDMDGVDAILSVSPYYNKPTQEGIYQHYKALAQVSLRPIILYNVPGRTMSNITAETTLRLARDFKNIIAIKEASGNLDQVGLILKHRPKDFLVISGDDALTLPMLAMGGDGVISVVGNGLPEEFGRLVHSAMKGDFGTARKEHLKLIELITLLFVEGNPGGIKEVLKSLGLCDVHMRLPLVPVSEGTAKKIHQALADAEVVKL